MSRYDGHTRHPATGEDTARQGSSSSGGDDSDGGGGGGGGGNGMGGGSGSSGSRAQRLSLPSSTQALCGAEMNCRRNGSAVAGSWGAGVGACGSGSGGCTTSSCLSSGGIGSVAAATTSTGGTGKNCSSSGIGSSQSGSYTNSSGGAGESCCPSGDSPSSWDAAEAETRSRAGGDSRPQDSRFSAMLGRYGDTGFPHPSSSSATPDNDDDVEAMQRPFRRLLDHHHHHPHDPCHHHQQTYPASHPRNPCTCHPPPLAPHQPSPRLTESFPWPVVSSSQWTRPPADCGMGAYPPHPTPSLPGLSPQAESKERVSSQHPFYHHTSPAAAAAVSDGGGGGGCSVVNAGATLSSSSCPKSMSPSPVLNQRTSADSSSERKSSREPTPSYPAFSESQCFNRQSFPQRRHHRQSYPLHNQHSHPDATRYLAGNNKEGDPRWSPQTFKQNNGIMEDSGQQDGAINLSTVREAASKDEQHINGDIIHNGENGHDAAALPSQSPRLPGKGTPVPVLSGAAKRKSKASSVPGPAPPSDSAAAAVAAAMQQTQQQQQNLMMLAAQQGLTPQQMQDLQQQLMNSPPPGPPHPPPSSSAAAAANLMHQHQQQQQQQQQHNMLLQQQKFQEQALQQLNEQLQVNILQQSQLLQSGSGDKNKVGKAVQHKLQQLALQQQQLMQQISQIQMQQRQYLLACLMQPFGVPQAGMMSASEMQQLWKEVAAQTGLEEAALKTLNGMTNPPGGPAPTPTSGATPNGQASHLHSPSFLTNGALDGYSLPGSLHGGGESNNNKRTSPASCLSSATEVLPSTPLFRHNLCKWPGCDTRCDDFAIFLKHLNAEHTLDDRTTAQARVQLQVVSQLETQVVKEKEMLQAMMHHLHMKMPGFNPSSSSSQATSSLLPTSLPSSCASPPSASLPSSNSLPIPLPPPLITPVKKPMEQKSEPSTPLLPKHPLLPPFSAPPFLPPVSMVTSPMVPLPLPPHPITSQSHLLMPQPPHPLPPMPSSVGGSGGGGAGGGGGGGGPIRRRVSDKCNLPISTEIQRNREFYKNTDVRPPFTYASLIRQAIIESPHRQLTLNEIYQWFQATFAYFRRNEATWKVNINAVRHNLSLHKCFARVENVKGAVWTVDEIEFYKRRPQKLSGGNIKSPSLNDPASYNETINATIRAAMGEASLALMGQGMDQDTAQDLSLKSLASSSHEGLIAMARSLGDEEMLLNIKREAGLDPDTPTFLDGPSPHGASPNPHPLPHPHHHLSPPPNRVVISLRDEDRGGGEVGAPGGINLGEGEGREPMATQVDLRGEPALGGGCVRVSPKMADNFHNGIPGDFHHRGSSGGPEETYEHEISGRETFEREIASRENYNRETSARESFDQEISAQENYDREMVGRESFDRENYERELLPDGGSGYGREMTTPPPQQQQEEEMMRQDESSAMETEGSGGREEEEEEEGLRLEGPQPTLEASDDDLMDNLPVFPVPHLQPVTSA